MALPRQPPAAALPLPRFLLGPGIVPARNGGRGEAFTLVELLVAMTVGTVLILILFQVFGAATRAWRQGEDQVETYREARAALQLMVRDLGQTIRPPTASAYAPPAPPPAAAPAVVAPALVLGRYPDPDPPRQAGDDLNEEVYCLTTIPNDGASSLCAVGYFCLWKPDFSADAARAPRAYSLMRQHLGSGAPATASTAAIPGLYDRFRDAADAVPLTFRQVFERARPPQAAGGTPPRAAATELAAYIWDLQIRTPATASLPAADAASDANNPYKVQPPYPAALPAYLEVRFKALSESAARRLAGSGAAVDRATWGHPADPLYRGIILPGTRQFSARVPLHGGSAAPAP